MTTPYYSVRTNEIPNMAGKALTVRGPVDPDSLGVTLMHEHLVDIPMPSRTRKPGNDTPATQAAFWDQPLTLENLHAARRDWPYIYDQYVLQDGKVAAQEVMEFKYHGGSTLVDLTCTGVGRDPAVLLRVSYATGLNIVMGTGWYTKKSYPEGMEQRGFAPKVNLRLMVRQAHHERKYENPFALSLSKEWSNAVFMTWLMRLFETSRWELAKRERVPASSVKLA